MTQCDSTGLGALRAASLGALLVLAASPGGACRFASSDGEGDRGARLELDVRELQCAADELVRELSSTPRLAQIPRRGGDERWLVGMRVFGGAAAHAVELDEVRQMLAKALLRSSRFRIASSDVAPTRSLAPDERREPSDLDFVLLAEVRSSSSERELELGLSAARVDGGDVLWQSSRPLSRVAVRR
ncbi:MAG: hypothetical protein IT454_17665 [Planctomycetes bacterium]|nr:hypothetical protein [Planctomycetota bacterium]